MRHRHRACVILVTVVCACACVLGVGEEVALRVKRRCARIRASWCGCGCGHGTMKSMSRSRARSLVPEQTPDGVSSVLDPIYTETGRYGNTPPHSDFFQHRSQRHIFKIDNYELAIRNSYELRLVYDETPCPTALCPRRETLVHTHWLPALSASRYAHTVSGERGHTPRRRSFFAVIDTPCTPLH